MNIFEAIGILGVIGSLIFVGLELRQSSSIARLEAQRAYSTSMTEFMSSWAESDKAAIIAKLIADTPIDEFSVTERVQAVGFYTGELNLIFGLFQSVQEGVLPQENLNYLELGNRLYGRKFFASIWPVTKLSFSDEFVNYFESLNLI